MSSYTQNVPIVNQTLGGSQSIINANFTLIGSNFSQNHVGFGLTNAGDHTYVDLVSQSSDSNPATGIVSHYSKSVSGATEWFFQRENSGGVIQMSAGTAFTSGAFLSAIGQTFIAGGIQLKWISFTAPGNTSTIINFTSSPYNLTAFPTQGMAAWVNPAPLYISGISTTSIAISNPLAAAPCQILIMGM